MSDGIEFKVMCGDKDAAVLDIVFVHGITGDAKETWTNPRGEFWPSWLADDLSSVCIYAAGYASSLFVKWTNKEMGLHERASSLAEHLVAHGIGKRPLVIVCHSLGGLIAKEMFRACCEAQDEDWTALAERLQLMIFFATPHNGTSLAAILKTLFPRASSHFIEALGNQSGFLNNLNNGYRDLATKNGVVSLAYYEKHKTNNVALVVSTESADPGCTKTRPIPVDADHISICKPNSKDAAAYLSVRRHIGKVLTACIDVNKSDNNEVPRLHLGITKSPDGMKDGLDEWIIEFLASGSHSSADRNDARPKAPSPEEVLKFLSRNSNPERVASVLSRYLALEDRKAVQTFLNSHAGFLARTGHLSVIKEAIDFLQETGSLDRQVLKIVHARTLEHKGKYKDAELEYSELINSANSDIRLSAIYGASNCCISNGDFSAASKHLASTKDVDRYEKMHPHFQHLTGYLLLKSAHGARLESNLQKSIDFFEGSLIGFKSQFDFERIADTLYHIADAKIALGLYSEASEALEHAKDLASEQGYRRVLANCIFLSGRLKVAILTSAEQVSEFSDAMKIFFDIGDLSKASVCDALDCAVSYVIESSDEKLKEIRKKVSVLSDNPTPEYLKRTVSCIHEIERSFGVVIPILGKDW